MQEEDGVQALRRAESAALDVALTEGGPLIAGVAGGVVTDPLDLARLHDGGFVVWLRADIATLAARVAGTDRPWLGTSPAVGDAATSTPAARRSTLGAATFIVDEATPRPN